MNRAIDTAPASGDAASSSAPRIYDSILDTIGNTPLVRLRNIARDYPATEYAADEAQGKALGTLLEEPAEKALVAEIDTRRVAIERAAKEGRGYREAYAEASKFEPVVARFFEEVFVMTDDQALRKARLRLMKRLETVILQLGDISEIVTTES